MWGVELLAGCTEVSFKSIPSTLPIIIMRDSLFVSRLGRGRDCTLSYWMYGTVELRSPSELLEGLQIRTGMRVPDGSFEDLTTHRAFRDVAL